jgi:hypothetical protein
MMINIIQNPHNNNKKHVKTKDHIYKLKKK